MTTMIVTSDDGNRGDSRKNDRLATESKVQLYDEVLIEEFYTSLRNLHSPDYTELVAFMKGGDWGRVESGFFNDKDAAVEFCIKACQRGMDVYYGANPRDRESIEGDHALAAKINSPDGGSRGKQCHIKRVVLQALDIDAVRKSQGTPLKDVNANEYELDGVRKIKQELLLEHPYAGIVDTGNGAHVLIQHPSTPLDETYRVGAKLWTKEVEHRIRKKLEEKGLEAEASWDDVTDPPRILRMPGTCNRKYKDDHSSGRIQRVATLSKKWEQAPASFPDELREKGRSETIPSGAPKEGRSLGSGLTTIAPPSLENYPARVNAYLNNHPNSLLADTLAGGRSEFIKGKDGSGEPIRDRSRYDISIAANAYRSGCTDEEVLQTMLSCPHGKARQEWEKGNKNYVIHKIEDASKGWKREQDTQGWDSEYSSPAQVAERFIVERYPHRDQCRTLLRFEKEYFRFDGQSWVPLSEEVLDSQINAILRNVSCQQRPDTMKL